MNSFSIAPDTRLGPVTLTTADLTRAIIFYRDIFGLDVLERSRQSAWLGTDAGAPLLVLVEKAGAPPRPQRSTGLYHFAMLLPDRRDLARAVQHLIDEGYPLQGMSDHLVSEALYLSDPDGNGIEIYTDRLRETWRTRNGQLEIATVPLNLNDLLGELDDDDSPWTGLPSGTCIGHVHLHVADLEAAEAFYRNVLGFDLVSRYGPSASFVSAGGYHHHIGMNTWAGVGVPSPPPDAVGLRQFTVLLPDEPALRTLRDQLDRFEIPHSALPKGLLLRDPSNNEIFLTVAPEKAFSAETEMAEPSG